MNGNKWIVRFQPRPAARARLFCFHHAGGGAALFRLWSRKLPETLEVCAVQLPGRSDRLREPVVGSMSALVAGVVPALRGHLDLPFAFFGHSMGAVLAAEVARALATDGGPLPQHLFVSSRRPPHVTVPDAPLHGLSDDEFVRETNRRYGGIPAELIRDRDVLALLLPGLRADMMALETHAPGRRAPLACPISAFGGASDPLTPRHHLDAWREETTGAFRVRVFPGDHFYMNAQAPALLADLSATIAPLLAQVGTQDVIA